MAGQRGFVHPEFARLWSPRFGSRHAEKSDRRLGELPYPWRMHGDDSSWLDQLLLGAEYRQSRDIKRLRDGLADASIGSEAALSLAHQQARRIDRLELLCEALVELVIARELIDRDTLAVLIAQIDLRDGFEDGSVGGDRPRREAPLCGACERPINPQRPACVYCGTATTAGPTIHRRVTRTVECGGCGSHVDERESNFTAHGLRCDACFAEG